MLGAVDAQFGNSHVCAVEQTPVTARLRFDGLQLCAGAARAADREQLGVMQFGEQLHQRVEQLFGLGPVQTRCGDLSRGGPSRDFRGYPTSGCRQDQLAAASVHRILVPRYQILAHQCGDRIADGRVGDVEFARQCRAARRRRRSGVKPHQYPQLGARQVVLFCDPTGQHVQCAVCGTRYRMDVLCLPTSAQMQQALPAGTRAAAVAMLRAGGRNSSPARRRAIDAVNGAGVADYDDAALDADLSEAAMPGHDLAGPLNRLTLQLAIPATEWFLAEVVRIGLADGSLSDEERHAAQEIAAQLGMTPAQARGVISMTEEGASA